MSAKIRGRSNRFRVIGRHPDGSRREGCGFLALKLAWTSVSEMFPTKICGTGQGFCYSFGRGIGAFFPALIGIYNMKWRLIAIPLFFGIATAIVIAALIMLPETKSRELATAFGEEGASGTPWMTS